MRTSAFSFEVRRGGILSATLKKLWLIIFLFFLIIKVSSKMCLSAYDKMSELVTKRVMSLDISYITIPRAILLQLHSNKCHPGMVILVSLAF